MKQWIVASSEDREIGVNPMFRCKKGQLGKHRMSFLSKTDHPWFVCSLLHGMKKEVIPIMYLTRKLRPKSKFRWMCWKHVFAWRNFGFAGNVTMGNQVSEVLIDNRKSVLRPGRCNVALFLQKIRCELKNSGPGNSSELFLSMMAMKSFKIGAIRMRVRKLG